MTDQLLKEMEDVGFVVSPLKECPHDSQISEIPSEIDTNAPCENCEDRGENWVCLTCFKVFCSRHREGHGVRHFENTQHSLALSYSDLSVWCYSCDYYLDSPKFAQVKQLAHKSKFGEQVPDKAT